MLKSGMFVHAAAASFIAAAFTLFMAPAFATGAFDGSWRVTAQNAGEYLESGWACPAIRFDFEIKDNELHGSLAFVSPVDRDVVDSTGRGAAPLTGEIRADGAFYADWMGIHGAGILSGDKGELKWVGECGPRTGSVERVN